MSEKFKVVTINGPEFVKNNSTMAVDLTPEECTWILRAVCTGISGVTLTNRAREQVGREPDPHYVERLKMLQTLRDKLLPSEES